jgi:DNA-binding LytR/AlgR family response regulator
MKLGWLGFLAINFKKYLGTPLFFQYNKRQRALIYLLVSILIGMVAFAGSTFHPGTALSRVIVGIAYFSSFGIAVVVISEIRIWLIKRKNDDTLNLTIGQVWIVGFIIFLLGYLFLGCIQLVLQQMQIEDLAYYFEPNQGFLPFTLTFLLKMFPTWAIDVFLVSHVILKKAKRPNPSQHPPQTETIVINAGTNSLTLNVATILHISIDQHYASFFLNTVEGLETTQIKSSMKNIMDQLPSNLFCRVHRSHAVNLNYVEKIVSKTGDTLIKLKAHAITLPVSRRQLAEVRNRLRQFKAEKYLLPKN